MGKLHEAIIFLQPKSQFSTEQALSFSIYHRSTVDSTADFDTKLRKLYFTTVF